jgi:hypothetical protein
VTVKTGAIFIGCALVACQALLGIHDRELREAGIDAAMEASIDPCSAAQLPPRPDRSTSDKSDNVEILAALSHVDLGLQADAGAPTNYGFNLDSVCTSCGTVSDGAFVTSASSCALPPGDTNACDLAGGTDLAGRKIFAFAQAAGLVQEDQINAAFELGKSGALIRIRSYNGQRDDASVTVSVYSSLGKEPDAGALRYDGTDLWTVDEQAVNSGDLDAPFATDESAYVSNNQLVATITFPITIGGSPIVTIFLTEAFIVANIQRPSVGPLFLQGQIGGRWGTRGALTSFQTFPDPVGGHLCGDSSYYAALKTQFCQNVDITSTSANDNKSAPCDAVSIGLRFEATACKFGSVVPHPEAGTPCGPSWMDSCLNN